MFNRIGRKMGLLEESERKVLVKYRQLVVNVKLKSTTSESLKIKFKQNVN